MSEIRRTCIDCGIANCDVQNKKYPPFCVSKTISEEFLKEALAEYEGENFKIMDSAAYVETEYYCRATRVEETVLFAKRMGYKKIGVATCVGLIKEANILGRILRKHGFEVYGIACKSGLVKKTELGLSEEYCRVGEMSCNPILQAKMLNKEQTDFNILLGLCVGHDSMFYRYSDAPVTTLVAKDRVLGHNPVAALYTADSYHNEVYQNNEK